MLEKSRIQIIFFNLIRNWGEKEIGNAGPGTVKAHRYVDSDSGFDDLIMGPI